MVRYNRMFALVLAFVMVFTLAAVPTRSVSAESASPDASPSLEVNIDSNGTIINGKVYIDLVNEAVALVGSMRYNAQTLMEGGLYVGEAGLAVSATPFLDQVYGTDMQNLSKNLPGSVFAPDSGSRFALDQETYDMLLGGTNGTLASQVTPSDVYGELLDAGMASLAPHMEVFVNSLMQNAQISVGPKTLSLPTGDVKVTASTVTGGSEAISEAMTAFIESLAGDPGAQAALALIYDELKSSGAFELEDGMEDITGKEFFDTLFEHKDELCQNFAAEAAEAGLTVTGSAAVDQQTEDLVSIGLEITANDETVGLELVFANGTYYLDVSDDGVHSKIIFCIQKNTDSLLVATLAVTEDDVETARVAFSWNKTAGTYEVTVADDATTSTMTGTITSDGTSTTITFDEIDGQSMGDNYIRLSINDPFQFPSYKEITTMTEEELLQLTQKFTNFANQLSE